MHWQFKLLHVGAPLASCSDGWGTRIRTNNPWNTVARLAPSIRMFRFHNFLFCKAMEDQANAHLFSHLITLCRFFCSLAFCSACAICCLCKESANTRAFLILQTTSPLPPPPSSSSSTNCVWSLYAYVCACVHCLWKFFSFRHRSSTERYIVYSILRKNDQPYSDVESGHWLLIAEGSPASRNFHPYPWAIMSNLPDKRNVCTNAMQHDKQSKTKSNTHKGHLNEVDASRVLVWHVCLWLQRCVVVVLCDDSHLQVLERPRP